MQTILVPVDFSKPSENALKIATKLFRDDTFNIIILHVIEIADPLMGKEQYYVEDQKMLFFMKLAQQKFAAFLDQDYLEGLEITEMIEVGSTLHGINKTIEKYAVDLIVMGSKGSSGLEEVLIGSNTEKVVRNSEVPVLVIKNDLQKLDVRKVIFASDFALENLIAYRKAKKITNDLNAELKLIYVNTPGDTFKSSDEIQKQIREFLKNTETPFLQANVHVHNDYSVEQGVLNAAYAHSADLIAMPTHGRTGLAHLFSGSIAEDVSNHSNIPVITFKIRDDGTP